MESNEKALVQLNEMHQVMGELRTSIQGLMLISFSKDPLKTEINQEKISAIFLELKALGEKMQIVGTSREEAKALIQKIQETLVTWEPKIRQASFGDHNGMIQGALTVSLKHLETIKNILDLEKH